MRSTFLQWFTDVWYLSGNKQWTFLWFYSVQRLQWLNLLSEILLLLKNIYCTKEHFLLFWVIPFLHTFCFQRNFITLYFYISIPGVEGRDSTLQQFEWQGPFPGQWVACWLSSSTAPLHGLGTRQECATRHAPKNQANAAGGWVWRLSFF